MSNYNALGYALVIIGLISSSSPGLAQVSLHIDNSNQQGCEYRLGENSVHLSVYPVQDANNRAVAVNKPYCNTLPRIGSFAITVDLTAHELRKLPIGVRLVRSSGDEHLPSAAKVLFATAPRVYGRGVISTVTTIDEPGELQLLIDVRDKSGTLNEYAIPVVVKAELLRGLNVSVLMGVLLMALIIGFAIWRHVAVR